jgi:hypothetical protein
MAMAVAVAVAVAVAWQWPWRWRWQWLTVWMDTAEPAAVSVRWRSPPAKAAFATP